MGYYNSFGEVNLDLLYFLILQKAGALQASPGARAPELQTQHHQESTIQSHLLQKLQHLPLHALIRGLGYM
eukprot:Clim_evm3s189 gene=Clim_evmTU3s189